MRSRPKRVYEATPGKNVAEGDRAPGRLADLIDENDKAWKRLSASLRRYGRESGLFTNIGVRRLGEYDSDAFQVSIQPPKSPERNLTDVRYGVSQATDDSQFTIACVALRAEAKAGFQSRPVGRWPCEAQGVLHGARYLLCSPINYADQQWPRLTLGMVVARPEIDASLVRPNSVERHFVRTGREPHHESR